MKTKNIPNLSKSVDTFNSRHFSGVTSQGSPLQTQRHRPSVPPFPPPPRGSHATPVTGR